MRRTIEPIRSDLKEERTTGTTKWLQHDPKGSEMAMNRSKSARRTDGKYRRKDGGRGHVKREAFSALSEGHERTLKKEKSIAKTLRGGKNTRIKGDRMIREGGKTFDSVARRLTRWKFMNRLVPDSFFRAPRLRLKRRKDK